VHTQNGYDQRWVAAINAVLSDRESEHPGVEDIDEELWDRFILPMIDAIEDDYLGYHEDPEAKMRYVLFLDVTAPRGFIPSPETVMSVLEHSTVREALFEAIDHAQNVSIRVASQDDVLAIREIRYFTEGGGI
jgi:hypothetical protein